MNTTNQINVVTIWWWNGSYNLLSAIRDNDDYNISAIISMSDSWGSTWVLREELWVLPPWDIRRWIMALSKEHEIAKQLFDYRYDKSSSVWGHNLWNLLITAMADITWNFDKWLKQISKMFRVKGRVVPVTLELSNLNVELENWLIIKWESNIDEPKHDVNLKIKRAFLTPEVEANPKAIKAIKKSDMIILSFWDLYTSIVPNLLVKWIKEAIAKNKDAKVVYFCNAMSKPWETTKFSAIDFANVIEEYLWEWVLDYVIVNNWYISEKMVEKYKTLENKSPVKVKDKKDFKNKKYKVIETDLIYENQFIRYHYDKVAWIIDDLVRREIR